MLRRRKFSKTRSRGEPLGSDMTFPPPRDGNRCSRSRKIRGWENLGWEKTWDGFCAPVLPQIGEAPCSPFLGSIAVELGQDPRVQIRSRAPTPPGDPSSSSPACPTVSSAWREA